MKQYFNAQYWKGQRLLLLAFLLVHVVVAAIHISNEGLTVDEPDYYTYAARWAHGKVERSDKMYDSKSPIVAVALIPRIIKQLQNPGYKATDNGEQDIKSGRYFMVIFTIIIALYLFVWIRKLFGARAWILPMLFFLLDPMVISFSMIITSDMATGACMIATMYHLWRFYESRQKKQFLIFSIWLGVSLVCKASLLFLLPCLLLMYLLLLITHQLKFNFRKLIGYTAVMMFTAIVIINAAYFFEDSFQSLDQMQFSSKAFKSLAATPVLSKIPVPLPSNYVIAQDLLKYHAEIGAGKLESSYPGVFINGEIRRNSGFWYYYLFIGFFKFPIAILLLVITGVFTLLFKFREKAFLQKYIWFLFPVLFFFILLSFFNQLQLGLRHLLMIYPLLFISIAALLQYWQKRFRFTIATATALFVFMIISISRFPDLIAYTNEFITDKKNVFKKIRDANIDYGQNAEAILEYVKQHPDVQIPPKIPKAGKYIVPMMGLFDEGPAATKPKYLWLLNFEPVAHYRYSMFMYNISEQDIVNLQQKNRP